MSVGEDDFACEGGCGTTFGSLSEMVPLPRINNQGVRHYCEDCAETVRNRKAFRRKGR